VSARSGHLMLLGLSYLARIWQWAKGKKPQTAAFQLVRGMSVLVGDTGFEPVTRLMARLGHSTQGAALRYQHASQDRDSEIARRLSAMIDGKS
jgi:hypothetical protein